LLAFENRDLAVVAVVDVFPTRLVEMQQQEIQSAMVRQVM
jgi:hypothetical protein